MAADQIKYGKSVLVTNDSLAIDQARGDGSLLTPNRPVESAERKSAAHEPLTKTFNWRFLTRNLMPDSRSLWEPP
jgi:hypothetical protein